MIDKVTIYRKANEKSESWSFYLNSNGLFFLDEYIFEKIDTDTSGFTSSTFTATSLTKEQKIISRPRENYRTEEYYEIVKAIPDDVIKEAEKIFCLRIKYGIWDAKTQQGLTIHLYKKIEQERLERDVKKIMES